MRAKPSEQARCIEMYHGGTARRGTRGCRRIQDCISSATAVYKACCTNAYPAARDQRNRREPTRVTRRSKRRSQLCCSACVVLRISLFPLPLLRTQTIHKLPCNSYNPRCCRVVRHFQNGNLRKSSALASRASDDPPFSSSVFLIIIIRGRKPSLIQWNFAPS